MIDLSSLENRIGYHFNDIQLLERALTHPSVSKNCNNQRLEFLGDAVLQLTVSDDLFHSHQRIREGALTNLRQHLVCQDALADVARSISLGDYLILNHGSEITGARENESILCDTCEAVIAAVYLDGGYDAAHALVRRLIPIDSVKEFSDAKSALQEYLQKRGLPQPNYVLISSSGPDHMPVFTMAVECNGKQYGVGTANGKKKAEQLAAEKALILLTSEETE